MKISLGFSPCPNDTFIFDALVNQKIDTGGLEFEVLLEDVQTLNQWAKEGRLDVSKISYGVLPKITKDYVVLNSGGALGKGVGPLLISSQLAVGSWQEIQELVNSSTIAIPGEDTTAHFLFTQAFPNATGKVFMRFDEIENWVIENAKGKNIEGGLEVSPSGGDLEGACVGVIIHENRFTYQQKGLYKLLDLGDYWEQTTGNPIPLGGIVAKRTLDATLIESIDAMIHQSLKYAFSNYPTLSEYVQCHAQEMSETVMRQHIDLYVNEYSLSLGTDGKAAVQALIDTFGSHKELTQSIFK